MPKQHLNIHAALALKHHYLRILVIGVDLTLPIFPLNSLQVSDDKTANE